MAKNQNIPHHSAENTAIELFGLNQCDIQTISTQFVKNGPMIIHVTLKPDNRECTRCHHKEPKISNYVDKMITHEALRNHNCLVHYRARRYKCPVCGKTYYERNPFVFKKEKITYVTVMNILEDLRDPGKTFSSVARDYHLSPTTVQNIFDRHVQIPRATRLPRVLQIDETYSFKSEKSKFVCMLLDYASQTAVDLLPSRRKDDLLAYFSSFPKKERQKVKYIATDMYRTYYDVCRKMFPHAIYAVDRFHVMQEFMRKYSAVRIRVMKGTQYGSDEYYLLKHQFHLLNLPDDAKEGRKKPGSRNTKEDDRKRVFDEAGEKFYNRQFKCHMNKYELRQLLLSIDPQINEIYELRNELSDFFRKRTVEDAAEHLNKIIAKLNASGIQEMNQFAETVIRWYQEILNSFHIVKTDYIVSRKDGSVRRKDYRLTSSMIENRNKIVKQIKNNANGYTNWQRFRNRVLYVLNKVPYRLEPIEDVENKDKQRK